MLVQRTLPILILLFGTINCAKNESCNDLVHSFSASTQSFMGCAVHYAEPVEYCIICGHEFSDAERQYNDVIGNEHCRAKYFDRDRINVVEMVYLNALSIFDAGSCLNCFDWVHNSKAPQKISTITTEFFDALHNFTNCLDATSHNRSACTNCLDDYNNVNGIYTHIQKDTKDNICFDIKDAMNKTRLNWSHDLKCCKDRKTSLTTFIVTSTIISIFIPFMFYTSFMFFGWRREQQDEPLIDSAIQPSTSTENCGNDMIEPDIVPADTNLLQL